MQSRSLILLLSVTMLVACTVGPDYKPPQINVPAAYKEQSEWKPATPQLAASNGQWWAIYNDAVLNNLEQQIDVSNQNLKAAEAAYRQAQAIVGESRAALFPIATLDASTARNGGDAIKSSPRDYSVTAQASWELDVWGGIRRTIESDVANAKASAADLAAARLSAQAMLASSYFQLRTQDQLRLLLDDTIAGYAQSLKIVQNQYDVGIVAKSDVLAAQAQLDNARAQAINVTLQRAQLEHAIAVLVGKTPAEFSIPVGVFAGNIPPTPTDVPSHLLERRPDIAAAEERMIAANAQIGVATAAYFPNLTLSANTGYASSSLSRLLQASNNFWSVGPNLAATLFDAGARGAQVDAARAAYDQTAANYRQTVLTGFQHVEDQLAASRILANQADVQNAALNAAQESQRLALNQYKAGIVPYTNVIVAQTTALDTLQATVSLQQNRLLAHIALIEALGGDWETATTIIIQ